MRKITAVLMMAAMCLPMLASGECMSSQFYSPCWTHSPQVCTTLGACTTQCAHAGQCGRPCATQAPQNTTSPTQTPTAQPTAAVSGKPPVTPTRKPDATKTPSTGDDYTTQNASVQEQIAFNLLNSDRAANQRQPLQLDATLSRLARLKSEDMRDNHYFSHESPTYGNVRDMLTEFGYSFNGCGENIGHHANVEKCQAAFLSSAAHRQNIMSTAWTKVGIGIALDENGYIYETQIFAR